MISPTVTATGELGDRHSSNRALRLAVIAFALGAVSFAVLMAGIGKPAMMYYDEAYFVPEARALLTGVPNPNPAVSPLVRPPFGKLLIAAGMKLAGDNPVGWRLASAVCGSMTVVAVYLWTYVLLGDTGLALIAAGLTFFDNFLFVMSRIAMMDAFFVCFVVWSLVAFTAALLLDMPLALRRILFLVVGVLIGLAGACKWNAVDTLSVYILVSLGIPLLARRLSTNPNSTVAQASENLLAIGIPTMFVSLIVAPLISYSVTFIPLFKALHEPFGFRRLLAVNAFIWHFSSTEISNRAIISAWYSWPLGWPLDLQPQRALSYLVGNPVVAWGGLLALGVCAWRCWRDFVLPEAIVILLFAANFLQWSVTPEHGLFYYYYYPCIVILGVAIAVGLRSVPSKLFGVRVAVLLLAAAFVVFLWCFPQMAHLQSPWDCVLGCWS